MERCEGCGKLIELGEGRCVACRKAARGDGVEHPEGGVRSPVKPVQEEGAGDVDIERPEPCVRCRKHHAMVDSDFCLACQLELLSLLGDAAHELFWAPPPPPKPPASSAVSLMNDIDEKRDRTATSRIRVAGGVKLK